MQANTWKWWRVSIVGMPDVFDWVIATTSYAARSQATRMLNVRIEYVAAKDSGVVR